MGRGGVFVGSRTAASIVCWSLKFLQLCISTFCYISKTETRTGLCEVHIISIIIPILFLLHSLNQPECRIESYAERINPCGLWVPAFAGTRILLCMRGRCRMGNSLCGQLNVEPKHMNLISWKIAKHVDVLKLFASIALKPVSLEQLLHYDVTTHSCETWMGYLPQIWSDKSTLHHFHFLILPSYLVRNNSV